MKYAVSVIVPTFNREFFLESCIDAILKQTIKPLEIIVVDDASTDNTQKILQQYKKQIISINLPQNQGVSAARNIGIKRATGDYIAFCDSDDLWNKKKLEYQINVFQKNPTIKVCHTDEIWIRNGIRVNPKKHHYKSGGWLFDRCLELCAVSPSSIIMHHEFFNNVGLFDENLPACEDYDLWLRASLIYPFHYIDKKLIIKNGGHKDQLSHKYWGMDRFRIQAIIKCIETNKLTTEQKQKACATLKKKCEILANGCQKHNRVDEAKKYQKILENYCKKIT